MHAPAGLAELEAGRRRLAFDELLALQLSLLLRRKLLQCGPLLHVSLTVCAYVKR